MIVDYLLDTARLEVSAIESSRTQNEIANVTERVTFVPRLIGRSESLLAPVQSIIGKQASHCPLEHNLALAFTKLELGRNARHSVDKIIVQKRHASLDGV